MKPFSMAEYTKSEDPLTFDFGYRLGGELKLFHAVSLRASVNAAVLLAARFPKIVDDMTNAEEDPMSPSLTAVVDDGLVWKTGEIGFALDMMKENRITVSAVAEMPRIAEMVRLELGA
jgi:hypothetical protein